MPIPPFRPPSPSFLSPPLSFCAPTGEIAFLERLSWEADERSGIAGWGDAAERETQGGGHRGAVVAVEYSPSGLYLATSGRDRRVLVWAVHGRHEGEGGPKLVAERASDADVCALRWHPTRNALALTDEEGGVALWRDPVPRDLAPPTRAKGTRGAKADAKDADGARRKARGGAGAAAMFVDGAAAMSGGSEDSLDSASDAEDSLHDDRSPNAQDGGAFQEGRVGAGAGASGGGRRGILRAALPHPQAPIQPGATPFPPPSSRPGHDPIRRRFLAYDGDGFIATCDAPPPGAAGARTVDVGFHDMSRRGARVPALQDYLGFEMGALGPDGTALAAPAKAGAGAAENNNNGAAENKNTDDGRESVLMYRPFASWAPNSEWTFAMPKGESITAVTCGRGFVAACTASFLRLFTTGGSPIATLSLPGAAVAVAASKRGAPRLALVHHAAPPSLPPTPTPGGGGGGGGGGASQALAFVVWDVPQQREVARGPLPLSPGAALEWLGFCDDDIAPQGGGGGGGGEGADLATCDGYGVVRRYCPGAWGGAWCPVFTSAMARKAPTERHCIVSVSRCEVRCVITKSSKEVPQVRRDAQEPSRKEAFPWNRPTCPTRAPHTKERRGGKKRKGKERKGEGKGGEGRGGVWVIVIHCRRSFLATLLYAVGGRVVSLRTEMRPPHRPPMR